MRFACTSVGVIFHIAMASSTAHANNNLFLPGDCCFCIRLREEAIVQLKTEPAPVFSYEYPKTHEGAFCGYAGYRKLQAPGMSEQFRFNLRLAYYRLRRDYPAKLQVSEDVEILSVSKETHETVTRKTRSEPVEQGYPAFFVNPSFSLDRFDLGLRYNEDWAAQSEAFGHRREEIRYDPLLPLPRAMSNDWRDAVLVEPLKVSLPPRPKDHPARTADETPLLMTSELKMLILADDDLAGYFERKDGLRLMEVTDESLRTLEAQDRRWVPIQDTKED